MKETADSSSGAALVVATNKGQSRWSSTYETKWSETIDKQKYIAPAYASVKPCPG